MNEQNRYVYEFGPFRLDPTRRVLLKVGEPVKLFPKEFETLLALVERSGQVLEKEELMRRVWHGVVVEESNLTTNISHLRKLLGENRRSHEYIVTVPGHGYSFVAGVRQASFDQLVVHARTIGEETEGAETVAETIQPAAEKSQGGTPEMLLSNQLTKPTSAGASLALAIVSKVTMAQGNIGPLSFKLAALTVLLAVSFTALFLYFFPRGGTTPAGPFHKVSLKQLTTNSKTTLASLSPDGKLFSYVSRSGGKESLWLAHVAGGEPVALREAAEITYRSLNFSSNGDSLYYVVVSDDYRGGALFRVPALGGIPEKLRDNVAVKVAFAPHMRQFAFIRNNHNKNLSSVVIADLDGTGERELVSRPINVGFVSASPSWSPDGFRIAVAAVTEAGAENSELFTVSVSDGKITPLTTLAWYGIASTLWFPDGKGLVTVAKEKEAWESFQLWFVSYPQGAARRVVSDLDTYGSALSLAADGELLLAAQGQRITNVWIAPASDLRNAKQITFSSIGRRDGWDNLAWTPHGDLLYGAMVRDSLTIWSMGPDGSNQKQITPSGYRDSHLSITADGRYVIFESNRSGSSEIWRAQVDGSDLRQLTFGGNNREPHVSSDGKWIVYTSLRDGIKTLWRASTEGGEPVRLAEQAASWPRISPNDKFIAYGFNADSSRTQLAIIPSSGGLPIKLFDVPRLANFHYGIRWTPDGKAVTYRDWANGIWSQPLAGGDPERLAGLPEEKLYSYAWSHDGKLFAFVRGAEIRDVVLLRNMQ